MSRFQKYGWVFGIWLTLLLSGQEQTHADELFRNVSRLFGSHGYGTLALNVGAFDSQRNERQFAYQVISRGGEASIPRQNSYCFVVVHYGGSPPGGRRTYEFERTTIIDGNQSIKLGEHGSTFAITDRVSANMPSYCFPWSGHKSFTLKVSSSDKWFNQRYQLHVR